MNCDYDSDWGGYLDTYGNPCTPDENQPWGGGGSGGGGGTVWTGGGVPPSITITPHSTQIASTNLDKWLQSISQWTALLTHQSSIPTPGANQSGPSIYPGGYPVNAQGQPITNLGGGNLGGTVGSSLQKFISSPTGLLVIGAAILLYMKPPGRR